MGHGQKIEVKQETFSMPAKAKNFTMALMVIGLVLAGIGIATMDKSGASHDAHATTEQHMESDNHSHAEGEHHSEEGKVAHEAAHEGEHHNVETEAFGPRIEYHAQDKPWTTHICVVHGLS